MTKPIVYTKHALTALGERELLSEWVERVVRHPQWREVDPLDAEIVRHFGALPERGGRYLRVVVVETSREYRIVSAFVDRRARPK